MSEPVYMFDGADPAMAQAYAAARQSFRYFWRECSWEARRIVPALDMAVIKLPFTDGPRTDGQPELEHMWVTDADFDGDTLTGRLLNAPNWLTSVREGDMVQAPFSLLEDWMMAAQGKVHGGYTVNLMRSRMDNRERRQHDEAWGLDFGDPAQVRVELEREGSSRGGFLSGLFASRPQATGMPEVFKDHPMCVNMLPKIEEQLGADPAIAQQVDDAGWTLLQREALAGNLGVVELLVRHGANVAARTPTGRTAAELARKIGWTEIADYLDGTAQG